MILAELELYHSRPIAPTRRVALGEKLLPVDPPPGLGGVLLGGIVASSISAIDDELLPDLNKLISQLEHGMRVPQPRLRYRYQTDRVGLQRTLLRLRGEGEALWFDFEGERASPEQLVLGAVYAAGQVDVAVRGEVMTTLRRAIRWEGGIGPDLIASLAGFSKGQAFSAFAFEHPVEWALHVLGFDELQPAIDGNGNGNDNSAGPTRNAVRRRFRELLMDAHPDRGGATGDAAQRIADLTEARRILLGRPKAT
ncbi:MAG: hypothetical protein HYX32_09480 [Actinobacteria bacterium]|nr:hypothetical protein [Actinomycetota bacterium]